MAEQNGAARMDRVERMLELLITDHVKFSDEHNRLLTAQIVLTDRIDKLAVVVDKLAEAQKDLTASQRHTDERLSILIQRVVIQKQDGFIRGRENRA